MMSGNFKEAKNELREVIARALQKDPQLITRDGEKIVKVVSSVEYKKIRKSQGRLSALFHTSPLAGVALSRGKDLPQDEFRT